MRDIFWSENYAILSWFLLLILISLLIDLQSNFDSHFLHFVSLLCVEFNILEETNIKTVRMTKIYSRLFLIGTHRIFLFRTKAVFTVNIQNQHCFGKQRIQ